jgi:hypothetical protein
MINERLHSVWRYLQAVFSLKFIYPTDLISDNAVSQLPMYLLGRFLFLRYLAVMD